MSKRTKAADYRNLFVSLIVLGLVVTAIVVLPGLFPSKAGAKKANWRTESMQPGFPNFDIRTDGEKSSAQDMANFRQAAGSSTELLKAKTDEFAHGEELLRHSVPNLTVEMSPDLKAPTVINADPTKGGGILARSVTAKTNRH